MQSGKSPLFWTIAGTIAVPAFLLLALYSFNSNMSGAMATELYEDAKSICNDPYASTAYDDGVNEFEDQILSIEARAIRADQLELVATMRRTQRFAELQIAVRSCENAVMDYFSEVHSKQANSFDEHWGWLARLHADCSRKAQENRAYKFHEILKPVVQAQNEETHLQFAELQDTIHRQIAQQPWSMRAIMRMCQ